jgi:hypothetical protein
VTLYDDWFYKNMASKREQIDKFWEERPEGMKICPNCWKIFDHAGHPVEGSWTCSPWCFDSHSSRHANELREDMNLDLMGPLLKKVAELFKDLE